MTRPLQAFRQLCRLVTNSLVDLLLRETLGRPEIRSMHERTRHRRVLDFRVRARRPFQIRHLQAGPLQTSTLQRGLGKTRSS